MTAPAKAPFCIAPWVHAYRGPDGFRSLCCLSTELRAEHDQLKDWWNSEPIRDARRIFLAGRIPSACILCIRSNRSHGDGYNDQFKVRYGRWIPEIAARTAGDGATDLLPRSIDYRTSHCNLRCRTCDARNSSSIYAEQARQGRSLPVKAQTPRDEGTIEPGALAQLEDIYWAGGEPFLSPAHVPVMDALLSSGRAGQVRAHYTSNLMVWTDALDERMRAYASAFASMDIGASIDGLGRVGAYVRPGWKEREFLENFRAMSVAAPRAAVYLDVTITNLGLLNLHTFLAQCARERTPVSLKLMECNGENDFLDVRLLRPEIIGQCLQRCERLGLREYYRRRLQLLITLLERRYEPQPFADRHRELAELYERLRGDVGFFERSTRGLLNTEAPGAKVAT